MSFKYVCTAAAEGTLLGGRGWLGSLTSTAEMTTARKFLGRFTSMLKVFEKRFAPLGSSLVYTKSDPLRKLSAELETVAVVVPLDATAGFTVRSLGFTAN